MPRKTFVAGAVLTDTDLNTYLMDQAVMTFADSTARSSAIPAPSAGMVTYLSGSTAVEFWNGSSWQNINDNTASIPLNTVTTQGDLIVATGNAAVARLGKGTAGQVLTAGTATLEWATPSADIPLNTVTASGDLIVANGSASVTRLGIGTTDQVLSVGTAGIIWKTPATVTKTVQTFTSSTTFIIPDGVEYVNIYLAGGGAGGGSGAAQVGAPAAGYRRAGGGSGGAGATVYGFTDVKVTPLSTATITIGAGGAGNIPLGISAGSANGGNGTPGDVSSVVLTTGTLTGIGDSGAAGKAGSNLTSATNADGGAITLDTDQLPTYMSSGTGGRGGGGSNGVISQALPGNERYLFTVAPLLGGTVTPATGATLAGTAGDPVNAGFAGGGGGGGAASYSSSLGSAVTNGGNGRYGGGAGSQGVYALSGTALVGAIGGNAATNSGAGGGGGGGAAMPNGTATGGAGGNGGSGFVIVTY